MNEVLLSQSDHLGLFPRSRLLAGSGLPLKSHRARVFRGHPQYRARDARARQHTPSEKAGTREHRERGGALDGGSNPRGTSFKRSVPGTPASASGAAPFRREDYAALVQVLETEGHFTPAPLDPPWADLRPDLAGDHARWLTLLELAYRRDGTDPYGVFGALIGIRCCGAATPALALARSAGASVTSSGGANPTWRLTRGELSATEWQAIRARWLMPHLKALQDLLGTPAPAKTEATQHP